MIDKITTVGLVSVLSCSLFSCATKKYVAGQVTPVSQRAQKAETRNGEQDKQLEVLETESSRAKESIVDLKGNVTKLDGELKTTTETAKGAASAATQAQQQAADARRYAGERSDSLEKSFDGKLESIDQLKLSKTTNVLFASNRSELTAEAKAALDELAKQATTLHRYAVEIQGYTDSTGNNSINLSLSQRRAEAVVRYLTMEHQVPLRRIHLIGAGSAAPIADNKTRDGRKQNRRVEIRLFVQDGGASATATSAQVR